MTYVYPVILTPAETGDQSGFSVYVPDLEINTQGCNLAEAITMARDAIGIKGICEQDLGNAIPLPSTSEPPHEENELVSWVDIDFDRYRKLNDMTSMRINVTLPKGLKVRGDEAKVNFSGLLQDALKTYFGDNRAE